MLALVFVAGAASIAARPPTSATHEVATAIARKLRCAPRLPGPCWRDPLTAAYGRALAGTVRALAPVPVPVAGLLPVDFRYCRQASCALPGQRPELTASNRRASAFVAVKDRPQLDGVIIEYWLYRPGLAWERITRLASAEVMRANAGTPLLDSDHPRLVALETLAGRNHVAFADLEEPPWRWATRARLDAP